MQRLAGSSLLAVMIVDRDARVHAANDAALGLVGVQANDRRVIEGGAPVSVEEWVPDARTGKVLCFISTKVPLRDVAGRPCGISGAAVDVTQQKLLITARLTPPAGRARRSRRGAAGARPRSPPRRS